MVITSPDNRAVVRKKNEARKRPAAKPVQKGKGQKAAPKKKKVSASVDASNADNWCRVCNGLYGEGSGTWIKCVDCSKWLHETCSPLDGQRCGLCVDSD